MTRQCLLDLLPVELLHTLFTYFWAHEILFSFHNVTDYADAVLLTYTSYSLNLSAIQKYDFELLWNNIHPKQVSSLILSDDNDIPGLSEQFLSRFKIEEFIQLRSLTLNYIDLEALKIILSNLDKLHRLRSFSFDIETIRHKYPAWNRNSSNEFSQFKSLLIQTYHQILPRLNYIYSHDSNDLVSISLPHLHYLKLSTFTYDHLKKIFQNSLQLKSFDIIIDMNIFNWNFIVPKTHLIRLNLKIKGGYMSCDEIKQLLYSSPHMKYLQLEIPFRQDIADGYLWKKLAKSFITFNFKFYALPIDLSMFHIDTILNSFRSPFWLEEKHWFIGHLDNSLFSIPYFTPTHADLNNPAYCRSTAPNCSIMLNHINKLIVHKEYDFSNIKIIKSIINFQQIKHLVVLSLYELLSLMALYSQLHQLNRLTIKDNT